MQSKQYTLPELCGRAFRELRRSKGLSQFDVQMKTAAQGEGMTIFESDISAIENGKSMPKPETYARLMKAINEPVIEHEDGIEYLKHYAGTISKQYL